MTRPAMTDEQWWEEFKKRYDFIVRQKNLKPIDCLVWGSIFAKGDCEAVFLGDLKHLPGIKNRKQLTDSLNRLTEYGLLDTVVEHGWKSTSNFNSNHEQTMDDHNE